MPRFIQVIEFQTSRFDELKALGDEYRSRRIGASDNDSSAPLRGTVTADRDRPGYYLNIVEFESADAAMENSNRPDTSEFAARMMELCDGPANFYNLDVVDSWER